VPIDAGTREALEALSKREGVTRFMTMLAVFSMLLARYSRQTDVLIGTPISGRHQPE
jgi:non-ribosomal peptide synthetase component F